MWPPTLLRSASLSHEIYTCYPLPTPLLSETEHHYLPWRAWLLPLPASTHPLALLHIFLSLWWSQACLDLFLPCSPGLAREEGAHRTPRTTTYCLETLRLAITAYRAPWSPPCSLPLCMLGVVVSSRFPIRACHPRHACAPLVLPSSLIPSALLPPSFSSSIVTRPFPVGLKRTLLFCFSFRFSILCLLVSTTPTLFSLSSSLPLVSLLFRFFSLFAFFFSLSFRRRLIADLDIDNTLPPTTTSDLFPSPNDRHDPRLGASSVFPSIPVVLSHSPVHLSIFYSNQFAYLVIFFEHSVYHCRVLAALSRYGPEILFNSEHHLQNSETSKPARLPLLVFRILVLRHLTSLFELTFSGLHQHVTLFRKFTTIFTPSIEGSDNCALFCLCMHLL